MKAVLLIGHDRLNRQRYSWQLLVDNAKGKIGAIVSGPRTYINKRDAFRRGMEWAKKFGFDLSSNKPLRPRSETYSGDSGGFHSRDQ